MQQSRALRIVQVGTSTAIKICERVFAILCMITTFCVKSSQKIKTEEQQLVFESVEGG